MLAWIARMFRDFTNLTLGVLFCAVAMLSGYYTWSQHDFGRTEDLKGMRIGFLISGFILLLGIRRILKSLRKDDRR